MILLIQRQVAWIQAAFGFYPHPVERVQPFEGQGWRGCRDRSFPEDQVHDILKAFLSRSSHLSVCHKSRHRTTYRIEPDSKRKISVFLKHYRCRILPLYNPRSYLRFGHAQKAFRLSYLIAKTGVLTPRILFYLREGTGGLRSDSLLATEGFPGGLDLKSWMKDRYSFLKVQERENFVRKLASFLARLHQNGICHGDFEANTLFDPQFHAFCLIDLDSIRIFGPMLRRDQEKQFTALERQLQTIDRSQAILSLFHQTYLQSLTPPIN